MDIGIDLISFYTPAYALNLAEMARYRQVDVERYQVGIGQLEMSVAPPDEDCVTLGASAAKAIVDQTDKQHIKALIVATESGIDQSKSAGIFMHNLLELCAECRIVEMKQACYSATFALQSAVAMLTQNPQHKILIICSDIAKYALNSPGEATQGAAAVAMLISANPRLIKFDTQAVFSTHDVMDFWRPNYSSTAMVDGQYSTKIYLKALNQCWKTYVERNPKAHSVDYFCFHLPFTRMAEKALKQIFLGKQECAKQLQKIAPSLTYNKIIGNSYTASLYLSFCSLLDFSDCDLSYQRIGFFSYGSGYVAEFFSGLMVAGYQKHLLQHQHWIKQRQPITYQEYLNFYHFKLPEDGSQMDIKAYSKGSFRLKGIANHQRLYEATIASLG